MAAYRVERTIDQAIQSVLAQRGLAFELLIGDDASPDGTWERICRYLSDPRVRGWRFRTHQGCASVRNRLIARAKGRFLSICDADDLMLPGNLARLAAILDRNPQVGVTYSRLKVIDERGRELRKRFQFPGPSRRWDLLRNAISHPGTMIRRSLLRSVGTYRVTYQVMSDYDLFLRLAEVAHIRPVSNRTLYAYRWHRRSLTRTASKELVDRTRRQVVAAAIARRYGYQVSWAGVRGKAGGTAAHAVAQ